MSITITGRVSGTAPGQVEGTIGVLIKWKISQPLANANEGEIAFDIDQQLTDQEMQASLREQLASYVSGLAGQPFADADVRGCSF